LWSYTVRISARSSAIFADVQALPNVSSRNWVYSVHI